MKIGFWLDYDQTWTFSRVFAAMRSRDPTLTACGFVMNDRFWQDAVDGFPPGTRLERFYDHYNTGLASTPDAAALARFAVVDRARALARIAYSDRHLDLFTYQQILAVNVHLLGVFDRFLDEEAPDAFIFNCVASQFAHLMVERLKARGIRVVIPFSYGVENLIYLADNPFLDSPDIWATHRAMLAGAAEPTPEEGAFAERFMAKIRAMQPAYANNAIAGEREKLRFPSLPRGIAYLRRYITHYRTDPTQPTPWQRLKRVATLRRNLARAAAVFAPREVLFQRPFIYHPLHYEPEVTNLVIAPCDQRSMIDMLARRMPLGWRLVVKEHPAMLSQRDPAFYRDITTRHPNVLLAAGEVPSLELLQRAEATVTLAGTVALEAAVLGRPIVTLAPSRFGGFGTIPRATDLFALHETLAAAMAQPPRAEEVRLMLCAIRRHTRPLRFAEPQGDPTVLDPANIAELAAAFHDHLAAA